MKIRDRRKLSGIRFTGEKNENKGLEEINMRSLSRNVKNDSQENVENKG